MIKKNIKDVNELVNKNAAEKENNNEVCDV